MKKAMKKHITHKNKTESRMHGHNNTYIALGSNLSKLFYLILVSPPIQWPYSEGLN
jgi:hypothetical protein